MGPLNLQLSDLPDSVRDVLHRFFTAEFSTIAKDGTPVSWPVAVLYREEVSDFLLSTSIGYPGKVYNVRRDDRVALSFSEPTGSGLDSPPIVVVQGIATVDEEIRTSFEGYDDFWVNKVMGPQPASKLISSSAAMRWFADFYYMRHYITVRPVRVAWWPGGDCSGPIESIGAVNGVG
jgi:hypothetical protein